MIYSVSCSWHVWQRRWCNWYGWRWRLHCYTTPRIRARAEIRRTL